MKDRKTEIYVLVKGDDCTLFKDRVVLADYIGCSRNTVANWFRGRKEKITADFRIWRMEIPKSGRGTF